MLQHVHWKVSKLDAPFLPHTIAFGVIFYAVLLWTNKRMVRKQLKPRLLELQKTLEELES